MPQIPHDVLGITAGQGETIDETTVMRNIEELLKQISEDEKMFGAEPLSSRM